MEAHKIVPDIIDSVPPNVATVRYDSGVEMNLGAELTPLQVKDIPIEVSWPTEPGALYTLVHIDLDHPFPTFRGILHWLVVNLSGNDLTSGETIAPYAGSGAPDGAGLHRYALLVFKQSAPLDANLIKQSFQFQTDRIGFNTRTFAQQHNLKNPIAGNLYIAQCDDYIRQRNATLLATAMKNDAVIPDVIDVAPNYAAFVMYEKSKAFINYGKELTPTQVKDQPNLLIWRTEPGVLYTLIMIDPDAPSRADPQMGEALHWLVVNIPGTDISKGETFAEYIGSGPPQGSGHHRYVLLIYKQTTRLSLNRAKVTSTQMDGRVGFKTKQFVKELNQQLQAVPLAGNFYIAQYDDYVQILHNQLGFNSTR